MVLNQRITRSQQTITTPFNITNKYVICIKCQNDCFFSSDSPNLIDDDYNNSLPHELLSTSTAHGDADDRGSDDYEEFRANDDAIDNDNGANDETVANDFGDGKGAMDTRILKQFVPVYASDQRCVIVEEN